MATKKRLAVGALLAVIGSMGIVLGPMLNLTSLGKPWSFILGFVFGVMAGAGAALSVFSLIESRKE
ncbi:MAG: hypothetical protein JSV96_03335 [Candidatus Aminicenantes bacterium]|nr:MAG: hypothetical protein JSV96_03335 [Candidatus Aminicenantes bacterium]